MSDDDLRNGGTPRSGRDPRSPDSAWAGEVAVPVGAATLAADLMVPPGAAGLVLFAHGSGSSRHSSRNRFVAQVLQKAGLATLLLDLLTEAEEAVDLSTRELRFNIGLLAERLWAASEWAAVHERLRDLPSGYFGASTGAAAALVAGARPPHRARAIVSRGGRPDLAGDSLPRVTAPVLLIVGGADHTVLDLNRRARARMTAAAAVRLEVVPGATHLFPEPGALEQVADLARDWLVERLIEAPDRD